MNYGKTEKAISKFQEIIDDYSWAQAWDPRGWFWSVKEKSQASIDVMTGKVEEDIEEPTKWQRIYSSCDSKLCEAVREDPRLREAESAQPLRTSRHLVRSTTR